MLIMYNYTFLLYKCYDWNQYQYERAIRDHIESKMRSFY